MYILKRMPKANYNIPMVFFAVIQTVASKVNLGLSHFLVAKCLTFILPFHLQYEGAFKPERLLNYQVPAQHKEVIIMYCTQN